jgi:[ribosomal protein S5]-alanine N-acetyltransferase
MLLRRLTMDDVDDLLDIFSDPEAMRYYPATKDRREAEDWVRSTLESYQKNGFGLWAAILKGSNEFAGQCGLVAQRVDGKDEVEIGYLFLRKFWRRGLATEAARACRDYGFDELGYARLISLIDPANRASRRVAEKVGMSLERQTQKWGKTVYVYSISNARNR